MSQNVRECPSKVTSPRPYGNSCLPTSFPPHPITAMSPMSPNVPQNSRSPHPCPSSVNRSPTQYFLLLTFCASRLAASPDLTVECVPTNVTLLVKSLLFISLEGGEGAGKTTQAARLADRIESMGLRCLWVHEPGSTALGTYLRNWIKLSQRSDHAMSRAAELFLFAAARSELVTKVIGPQRGRP